MLLAVALLPAVSAATTVVAEGFAQICTEADVIFVGTVADVRSQWVDASQRAIETLVTFDHLTIVSGTAGDRLTLRFSGGEVDDIREEVAGVPHFTVGARVLLFARQGRSISPVVGLNQGYFRIVDSPRGPIVLNADDRAVVGVRNDVIEVAPASAGTESAVPLSTFLESVRQQVITRDRD